MKKAEIKTVKDKDKLKRRKRRFFESYISKILKQVSSDKGGITSNAKQQLNSVICIIAKKISSISVNLTEISKKKTISTREIVNSVKILLSGEMLVNSIKEGEKSVVNFKRKSSKGNSRQGKAGIIFPPSVTEQFLRNFGYSNVMVTNDAPVYLAAVLEYISSEILSISLNYCQENKRVRITIRDLQLSILNDIELSSMFDKVNVSFMGGGVLPFIHESLTVKKPRKKRRFTVSDGEKEKKPHRFRQGTVAIREIRKQQKTSNKLHFAKFPFERLVRSIVNKTETENVKISKNVFTILQYCLEEYIVSLLHDANLAAIHSNRVKLMDSDIELICKLRNIKLDKNIEKEYDEESVNNVDEEIEDTEEDLEEIEDTEEDIEEDVEEIEED